EDDGVGALARLDLGQERGARDLDRLRALRVGGGELGPVGVEEAVDDRRGEKLCEPLQHGLNLRWRYVLGSAHPRESGDPESRTVAPGSPLARGRAEGWG